MVFVFLARGHDAYVRIAEIFFNEIRIQPRHVGVCHNEYFFAGKRLFIALFECALAAIYDAGARFRVNSYLLQTLPSYGRRA